MPSNTAAWQVAPKAKPLEVGPAEYTHPAEHEIVVKSCAVAINPADWYMQDPAPFPLKYPTPLGQDVAGEVVEVGSSVTRFRVGDRVLGHATGMVSHRNCDNTFQEYCVLMDNMASPIPSSISFEAASVLPLGLSTAACGMYQKEYLNLHLPSVTPKPTGQVVLVWGGASSVGSNGIQLGVASGYEVFETASAKNFDYVKKLGASQVFDYRSKTVVKELVEALKGKTIAGVLDCITVNGVAEMCAEVLSKSEGRKFISTARRIQAADELPGGVKTKWIFGLTLKDNEVSKAVYEDFLPEALAAGTFVPAPEPEVVGKGLHAIQDGLDAQRKGVSAKKIVITL
ncbi:unnamed protein product [Calypogeia fissa]